MLFFTPQLYGEGGLDTGSDMRLVQNPKRAFRIKIKPVPRDLQRHMVVMELVRPCANLARTIVWPITTT